MSIERIDTAARIATAGRRVEWAGRALAAAAVELEQARAEGAPVGSTADLALTEAACAAELARRIGEIGRLAESERRVRDRL